MAALAVQEDASSALPRMTKKVLLESCLANDGYELPELNDNLYLHFRGFQRIENLEEYTGLKGLWLEANGLSVVENLGHLHQLRCLFLSRNLIRTVHGLDGLWNLVTLDLSENRISVLERLACAVPLLETLNVSKNELRTAAALGELARLENLKNLNVEQNSLEGEDVIEALAAAPKLCGININGNPCVSQTPQFRKKCLVAMPLLAYLDRPVFEGERAAALAWKEGGHEAEQKCKRDFAQAKRDKDKQQMAEYRAWQAKVRKEYIERKAMEARDTRGAAAAKAAEEDLKHLVQYTAEA